MDIALQRSFDSFQEEFVINKLEKSTYQENNNEIQVAGDGNCLFRCIAIIMFDDQKYHYLVREKMIQYLQLDTARFLSSPNLEGSIDTWIGKMINSGHQEFGISGEYGDSFAIEILSWMLEKPIQVSICDVITNHEYQTDSFGLWFDNQTIRLILRGNHFTLLA